MVTITPFAPGAGSDDLANETAFHKLLASLGPAQEELVQQNVYFASADTQGVLRLRSETANRSTEDSQPASAYFEIEEYEVEISEADWKAILSNQPGETQWQLEPLAKLAENNGRIALNPAGTIDNLRLVYRARFRKRASPA